MEIKITFVPRIKIKEKTMVKFIWKEADENSPIYKTGFIISSVKLNKSKVKLKEKEIINEKIVFFLNS